MSERPTPLPNLELLEPRLLLSAHGVHGLAAATPLAASALAISSLAVDNAAIAENATVNLQGAFAIAADAPQSLLVDWGDGSSSVVDVTLGQAGFTAAHQYLDNAPAPSGAYTINVSLGQDALGTTSVTVNNVAPAITDVVLTPTTNDENGTATLSGSFTDPGTLDAHTVLVNWGDGSAAQTVTLNVGDRTFTADHQYLDDNPTGTASDIYTVTVTVSDDDAGTATASSQVTVNNVAPTITNLTLDPVVINENDVATLNGSFNDPGSLDTHTVLIDWGDGSAAQTLSLNLGDRTFTADHQYLDDNPTGTPSDNYTVTVTVTDDDTGENTSTTQVTVNNVAPTITDLKLEPVVINENDTTTLSGSFTDPGTLDTHTVLIDWGDGSPAQTLSLNLGDRTFTADHQYLDDNPTGTPSDNYTVTVTVTDDDTGANTSTTQVTVNNVAPVITSLISSAPGVGDAKEGQVITLSGAFTDVGTLDTHTAIIQWGDGTSTAADITEAGGSGTLAGSHSYTSGGIYTITVTLSDDDTGTTTGNSTAVITGVGVHDGVLQIIGSKSSDSVHVNQMGNGQFKVHASFLSDKGHWRNVNLAGVERIEVLLGDGNDTAMLAGNIIQTVVMDGGAGNDKLKASAGPSVLTGGEGNDFLMGGRGPSILIGGTGDDRFIGGPGGDLLIGGRTTFDPNDAALTADFDAPLLAILAEWTSTRDLATRQANLTGTGTGEMLNGTFFLQAGVTVFDGSAGDKATGCSGADLYFDLLAKGKGKNNNPVNGNIPVKNPAIGSPVTGNPGNGNGQGNGNGKGQGNDKGQGDNGAPVTPPVIVDNGQSGQDGSTDPSVPAVLPPVLPPVMPPVVPPVVPPVMPGNGHGNGNGNGNANGHKH